MGRRVEPGDAALAEAAARLGGPAAGRLLSPVVGYVKRKSAVRQAELWNQALHADQVQGREPAFVVRVSDRKDADGTWKLVWHQIDPPG